MHVLSSDINENFNLFITQLIYEGQIWGLKSDIGWLVCDSTEYEECEVMPFWSSEKAAGDLCVGEWDNYSPVEIGFEEFASEWLQEFVEDGTLIGVNWNLELEGVEIDASDLAQQLVEKSK